MTQIYIEKFFELSNDKVAFVGRKNASLREIFNHLSIAGIKIPDGFSTAVEACWLFSTEDYILAKLTNLIKTIDLKEFSNLLGICAVVRAVVLNTIVVEQISREIKSVYRNLHVKHKSEIEVTVRGSETGEDLPTASCTRQYNSFLYIKGDEVLLHTWQKFFALLFNDRAKEYRINNGLKHRHAVLSVGVQKIVSYDLASADVDRDFAITNNFFDENNAAVKSMVKRVIKKAKK